MSVLVTQYVRWSDGEETQGLLSETRNTVLLDLRVIETAVAMRPDPDVPEDEGQSPTENATRMWRHLLPIAGDLDHALRVTAGWTLEEIHSIEGILLFYQDALEELACEPGLLDGTRETLRRDRRQIEQLSWQWKKLGKAAEAAGRVVEYHGTRVS